MTIALPIWSDDFLEADVRALPEYVELAESDTGFERFLEVAREALRSMEGVNAPDEALTIERVIGPILDSLGWTARMPERSLSSFDAIDIALYDDDEHRESLLAQSERKQVLGARGIVEAKRWRRDFDSAGSGSRHGETAAQQTQRYLLLAAVDSDESLRWGMLTNGARWRLYSYHARPRERSWEIDLAELVAAADLFSNVLDEAATHQLRTAYLLLRRESWIPAEGERECFLDRLLEQGRRRDAEIADDLSEVIFRDVYPTVVRLFWDKRPQASADDVARAALLLLYRLLFIYYAEDRGMLNPEDDGYRPYSLRHGVRDPVSQQHGKAAFSSVSTKFWDHLKTLRAIIDQGDASIGQPAYNGGLFADSHQILDQVSLSDAELAGIVYSLSHTSNGTYVSYRNLEVQQLGSIYERLLERIPRRTGDGEVAVTISPYARKDSGSYYTPQELVDLIVEQTLSPLVAERVQAFRDDPENAEDPAEAILALRVLDPAMGSGHFLITAIDWLAEQLIALVNREWPEAPGYVSPIREQVWELQDTHPELSDEALLRRMVLKRCIYGVDKNPMAVELARVALWLHSFTGALPLPYLEHRIVTGDSLLGVRGQQARKYIEQWGPNPMGDSFQRSVEQAATEAAAADDLLDLTLLEISESRQHHDEAQNRVERQRGPLNLVAGLRMQSAGMKVRERQQFHEPLAEVLGGDPGRAMRALVSGENADGLTPVPESYRERYGSATALAAREHILHWELAFPQAMTAGGFDAVIGNPPWDRIKLQEVEWWAARDAELARARTAAERKRTIGERRAAADPLVSDFDRAAEQAQQLSALIRTGGDYPLLGRGDINLYSLFVERSLSLLRPTGVCGLLTPSGIYADKTAAEFFRSVSTTGRLAGIYDFENRRSANPEAKTAKWFADVHPQFKFCATIIGGAGRRFAEARCGFFLDGQSDLEDEERVFPLAPSDFQRINPNTGTAPILRSRRDAELVSRIYREHPVLVDRSSGEERRLYPVRYHTMFHMAGDSHLFRTAEELESEGAYRVVGNRYKRGDDEWAPLYQGRMIHQFDHRANQVGYNPESTHNPYVSVPVTESEHANASFHPATQYWVPTAEISSALPESVGWTVSFRDITNATNERTMISTIAPWAGFGHTIPMLLGGKSFDALQASSLVGSLNSLVCDYITKIKLQGTHATWYTVEQLPMIHPDAFERRFGDVSARELVCDHVLRLTYTSWDMQPFARDLGYDGDPYIWNAAERRQLRARLDALFFHLYGLSLDETSYVLDQFPVLKKNEVRQHGKYLTKHLVEAHYRALEAGDTTSHMAE